MRDLLGRNVKKINGTDPLLGFVHDNHSHLPPKSPDDGGGAKPTKVTFRYKVMGNRTTFSRMEKMDLIKNNLFKILYEGGVRIEDNLLPKLWEPYKDVIMVKFLGKAVSFYLL